MGQNAEYCSPGVRRIRRLAVSRRPALGRCSRDSEWRQRWLVSRKVNIYGHSPAGVVCVWVDGGGPQPRSWVPILGNALDITWCTSVCLTLTLLLFWNQTGREPSDQDAISSPQTPEPLQSAWSWATFLVLLSKNPGEAQHSIPVSWDAAGT